MIQRIELRSGPMLRCEWCGDDIAEFMQWDADERLDSPGVAVCVPCFEQALERWAVAVSRPAPRAAEIGGPPPRPLRGVPHADSMFAPKIFRLSARR